MVLSPKGSYRTLHRQENRSCSAEDPYGQKWCKGCVTGIVKEFLVKKKRRSQYKEAKNSASAAGYKTFFGGLGAKVIGHLGSYPPSSGQEIAQGDSTTQQYSRKVWDTENATKNPPATELKAQPMSWKERNTQRKKRGSSSSMFQGLDGCQR